MPFHIHNSTDVSISGLSIEYDYPFVLEGRVVANSAEDRSFTIDVHPDNRFKIEDGELLFMGYDWESPLGENIVFDPDTRSPIYSTELYDVPNASSMKARLLSGSLVELSNCRARVMPPVGSIYTDKGPHGTNRRYPAFSVQNSNGVTLKSIDIHQSGAMALIVERSSGLRLDGFNTFVREGSDRMLSASADATHFVNCRGVVVLENCRFESMLDDATNIHGTYMKLDQVVDTNRFRASFGHYQQEGFEFAAKGDTIQFINRATLMPLGVGVVESIDMRSENSYYIDSTFDLRTIEGLDVAVENISYIASAVIRNCRVRYNRARSLLISTKGDVLIERCEFASMMAGIRVCGDANYWFESGDVGNLTVRGNRFTDLGIGGYSPQAILQIDPVISKNKRGEGYYHRKVVFEDNLIETFDSQVIYALSVDSLIIRNNRFVDSRSYTPRFPELSVVDVQFCNNIIIERNDFSRWSPDATISIVNCANPTIDNGALLIVENPNKFFYEN